MMDLGTPLPNAAALNLIVAWWNQQLGAAPYLPALERAARKPLLYERYCYAIENRDRIDRDERRRAALADQEWATGKPSVSLRTLGDEDEGVLAFLRQPKDPGYTPDLEGYLRYLRARLPLDKAIAKLSSPATFPEVGRRMHTLVVAATGHGKSELLKALLHHYAMHGRAGVLVLDPGRNLAVDVARWPVLHRDRRVIYVEPELRPGLTVGINPFSGGHRLDEIEKNILAETIGLALSEMTQDLTGHMKTLVTNCAMVLLDRADATMQDLGRMARKAEGGKFQDERRDALMQAAQYHRDPDLREFFQQDFDSATYTQTRLFLAGRLNSVTAMLNVRNTLFGPATLDLERELDAGKFILVNLARYGGREQRAAVGRMFVAMVSGIAMRRAQEDRAYTPIHLVVDEVTAMASQEMIVTLNENRKFGVHATFAQQVDGAGFTTEQAQSLVRNTRCRLAATDDPKEGAALLGHRGDPKELPPLQSGQFWVRWEGVPGIHTVQVRSDLVVRNKQGELQADPNPEHWLPEPAWQAYLDRLTATPEAGGYYRQARQRPLHEDGPPPPEAVAAEKVAKARRETTAPKRPDAVRGRTARTPKYTLQPEEKTAKGRAKTPGKSAKTPSLIGRDDDPPD